MSNEIVGSCSGVDELRRTPLYANHLALGGKIVPFAGWELPVQYTGVIPEHRAVRTAAGIFDVSHMGEIWVRGSKALATLQSLTCNDISRIDIGRAQYNALINEKGGVVDDIITYRIAPEVFLLCVNASNTTKDYDWISEHNMHGAEIENASSSFGQIAVQGPKGVGIASEALGIELSTVPYFGFVAAKWGDTSLIVARTGYTGEDGVEIFVPSQNTTELWDTIIRVGTPYGLIPAGLGARDTLRLEACYPLHGHELGDDISALESGLGWIVKFDKGDFIGRDILERQKREGAPRKLVGFVIEDPGIARYGDVILSAAGGATIGAVTRGTKTPTIDKAPGLALVDSAHGTVGEKILISVRGRNLTARVVKTPFYKRAK